MEYGWNHERIIAIVRLAATLIVSVGAGFGLALDADAIVTGCLCALSVACFIWSWWKNNNMTVAAQDAQKVLDAMRDDE